MSEEIIRRPRPRFVTHLPDLMVYADYASVAADGTPSERKKVRLRITVTDEGIEILADSAYPFLLEKLLAQMGADEVEKVLCG